MSERRLLPLLVLVAVVLTAYRMWVIHHLGIDLYVDEAYYWGWSQALDWGYYSKPPVVAALIAGSTALFGNGLLAIKLPSLLLYPATAVVLFCLGRRLFDPLTGLWAGLLLLTMPLVAALGLFVSTDAPLLLCWSLAMLFLLRAAEDGRWRDWLACGVAVGIGLMSKYTMAAFLPSALFWLLIEPRHRRWLARPQPWVAVALAVVILAPNLWWNWAHDFPTFRHTADITHAGENGWHPGGLVEFLGAQWLSLGPLAGIVLVWGLARMRRVWPDASLRMLLAFVLPLFALVCLQALTARAGGNWAAPIFVGICLLVPALMLKSHPGWVKAAVAANLVLGIGAYHWIDIAHATGIQITERLDPYKRARGWSGLSAAVAPYAAAYPDAVLVAEDRELLAHLIYKLHPKSYASWNPRGEVIDQYELTTTLADKTGRDLLFISRSPDIRGMAASFDSMEPLATVRVTIHPDFRREVYVFLLHGFKGYRQP
ncbi:MAG: glycosyltransferase family 39 protein [Zoogloea sp.]|nr:glycosyltransferase family 39 protein [Zoogloea sp.]